MTCGCKVTGNPGGFISPIGCITKTLKYAWKQDTLAKMFEKLDKYWKSLDFVHVDLKLKLKIQTKR